MSDPFSPSNKSQLIREAQIGFSVIAILLMLFVYVAYYRITGQGNRVPEHVRLAPVAIAVWPNDHEAVATEPPITRTAPVVQTELPAPLIVPALVSPTPEKVEIIALHSSLKKDFNPPSGNHLQPKIVELPPTINKIFEVEQPKRNVDRTDVQPVDFQTNVPLQITPPLHPANSTSDNDFQPEIHHPEDPVQKDDDTIPFDPPAADTLTAPQVSESVSVATTNQSHSAIRKTTEHRVVQGDSFWSIAQDRYGDGRFFHALYLYNQNHVENFNDLPAGTRIHTPDRKELIRLWPSVCPSSEKITEQSKSTESVAYYQTQDGDTLFQIAAQQFGQASRYVELLELNRARLPNDVSHLSPLQSGIHLVLPTQ